MLTELTKLMIVPAASAGRRNESCGRRAWEVEIVDEFDIATVILHDTGDIITSMYVFGRMVQSAPVDSARM